MSDIPNTIDGHPIIVSLLREVEALKKQLAEAKNAQPPLAEPNKGVSMTTKKGPDKATAIQRQQLMDAVQQGFLDSVLVSDLATAVAAGFVPGKVSDAQI